MMDKGNEKRTHNAPVVLHTFTHGSDQRSTESFKFDFEVYNLGSSIDMMAAY